MRILHVITNLKPGGAERLMVDLLPHLKGNGNDVALLLFNGVETPFKNELRDRGIDIFELSKEKDIKKKGLVYSPLNVIKLAKYLKQFDIIHTHNTPCQFFVAMASSLFRDNAKLVTTEHSTSNRRRKMRWIKPIDEWMYNQYNAIVCVSEQTNVNLKLYIGACQSICTIVNGVNVERFIKPIKEIDATQTVIITMVAAFRKEKDQETVLRALMHLPDNYRLQFVGRGDTESHVKSVSTELGLDRRVTFMGMRYDIPNILEKSDFVVLSSHWEGFGLAAVEAMASGRPLVASDVGGLRDVVSGAGVLFPHGDDKALAKAIQELCENPDYYRKVAQACQERAKKYDISVMAEGYLKLYESLMENNN